MTEKTFDAQGASSSFSVDKAADGQGAFEVDPRWAEKLANT